MNSEVSANLRRGAARSVSINPKQKSVPYVSFIEFDLMFVQKGPQFLLKGHLVVVFVLSLDVVHYLPEIRLTH